MEAEPHEPDVQEVAIPVGRALLHGTLGIPPRPAGVVLFAHGSGSGRRSRLDRRVAVELRRAGLATLLFGLLTPDEERTDRLAAHFRFDVGLLAERLVGATEWVEQHPGLRGLPVGYFGAGTGAAAALVAAGRRPNRVAAVISRGGRPDLARPVLTRVRAPTLLIVGGRDTAVVAANEEAMEQMLHARVELEIVPGATHLFEEPGAPEEVAGRARDWLSRFLAPVPAPPTPA